MKQDYNTNNRVKIDDFGINGFQLMINLRSEKVLARHYFNPGFHQMEPFRSCFTNAKLLVLENEKFVKRVVSLPSGTSVERKEIEIIGQIMKFLSENKHEVRQKLEII